MTEGLRDQGLAVVAVEVLGGRFDRRLEAGGGEAGLGRLVAGLGQGRRRFRLLRAGLQRGGGRDDVTELAPPVTGLTAGFFQQAHIVDEHAAIDRLAHVVNGQ